MKFQTGDLVVYGTNGVCKITEIVSRTFYQISKQYYVLHPIHDPKEVIYIPVDSKASLQKMRPVLSSQEIYDLIHQMPNTQPCDWVDNDNQRKRRFQEILSRGSRTELMQMIRTLYHQQQKRISAGKKLSSSDEHFFHEAENLLYEEFAVSLHLKQDQVLPFLIEQFRLQQS
ncbi:MAG: CarD family transcriptional regulator [Massiliimalia sp.]|jgi:CarD family transcriptional regulator